MRVVTNLLKQRQVREELPEKDVCALSPVPRKYPQRHAAGVASFRVDVDHGTAAAWALYASAKSRAKSVQKN